MIKKYLIIMAVILTITFLYSENALANNVENFKKIDSNQLIEKIDNDGYLVARRGGGFKSGAFKKNTPSKTTKTTKDKKDAEKNDIKKPEEKKGSFMGGMFGGMLAGTLLGSLFGSAFGGGLGTFLMMLILVILGYFIYKIFKAKKDIVRKMEIEEEVKRRMEEEKKKGEYIDI